MMQGDKAVDGCSCLLTCKSVYKQERLPFGSLSYV